MKWSPFGTRLSLIDGKPTRFAYGCTADDPFSYRPVSHSAIVGTQHHSPSNLRPWTAAGGTAGAILVGVSRVARSAVGIRKGDVVAGHCPRLSPRPPQRAGQRAVDQPAHQIAVGEPHVGRLQHQHDGHLVLWVDPEIGAG